MDRLLDRSRFRRLWGVYLDYVSMLQLLKPNSTIQRSLTCKVQLHLTR